MKVKTASDELADYLKDASNMGGGSAERLYLPETADEIADILKKANKTGEKITISGARTGTVGGAVPFGGSVISLEKFDRIESIDREAKTADVKSGVLLADLQKAVETERLFYPPDPTEWSCQVGGTVATNASGSRSFKYGSTRDYVRSLEIVLPTGDLLDLKRGQVFSRDGVVRLTGREGTKITARIPTYRRPSVRKNTCGYFSGNQVDAIDLFIGSEGTLGVITKVELALLPKPAGSLSGIVFFRDQTDLLDFTDEARDISFESRAESGPPQSDATIDASLIEYFDRRALEFISEKFPEVPDGMAGAVFFEQMTADDDEDALYDAWNSLLDKHNADLDLSWFAVSENDLIKMREFRHALPVAVNERVVRNRQRKIGTDMALPDRNFHSFLNYCRGRLDSSGIEYVIFGHIGDSHLHINLLPKDDEEAAASRHLYGRFIAHTLMLGGTVSAEHGIGKLKSKYLYVMYGERYLNEMAELKRAFDPKGILGIGNMFDAKFPGDV